MAIIIVQKGIRDIPYYLYEPIKRKRVIKAKQGEHETISLQALSLCICVCAHLCAILSLEVLLTSNNNSNCLPNLKHKRYATKK